MAFLGGDSVSTDSLQHANTQEPFASTAKHNELTELMKTLNHRYSQYLKRHAAGGHGGHSTSSNTDFLNNASPSGEDLGSTGVSAMPSPPLEKKSSAAGRIPAATRNRTGNGAGGGSHGEDADSKGRHGIKNVSGILSTTSPHDDEDASTIPQYHHATIAAAAPAPSRRSPSSIVLPAKSSEYWGERELYMAAEDVCRYLSGGVNYRQMCLQYQRVLDLVVTMIREDIALAQTVLGGSSDSSSGGGDNASDERAAVAEDLLAVDNLLCEIRSLLQESKQLLKENGLELPASFAKGLLNDQYNVMSTSSLSGGTVAPATHNAHNRPSSGHRGGGVVVGSVPNSNSTNDNSNNRTGPASASLSNPSRNAVVGVGRAYAGRPVSHDDARSGRQSPSSSVAIMVGPTDNPDAATAHPAPAQRGSGPHTGYTPLLNGELASLLKPVSQYNQPTFPAHPSQQQQQQQQQQRHSGSGSGGGGGILQRTGSSGNRGSASGAGAGGRRGSTSTLTEPSGVAGTAHPTRSGSGAAVVDDSFADPIPEHHPETGDGGGNDFLHDASGAHPDHNQHRPQQQQSQISQLEALAGTAEEEEEGLLFAPGISAITSMATGADDSGVAAMPPSVETMSRDRLQRLQFVYGEGYHFSGMDFLLDAMGLVFRNEYDQGKASEDVKGGAFRTFRKDVADRVTPALETYEGFKAATSDAAPLRSVYLNHCFLSRAKPNDKVLEALTAREDRDIEELRLDGAKLGDGGLSAALCVLPRLHRLRLLDLSYNELHDESIPIIARAVRRRPALTTVNLSCNYFTSASLPHLVVMARTVPRIKDVVLQGCELTQEEKDLVAAEVANPATTANFASMSAFTMGDAAMPTLAPQATAAALHLAALRAGSAPMPGGWRDSLARNSPAPVAARQPGERLAGSAFPRSRYYMPLTGASPQHEASPSMPVGGVTGTGVRAPYLSPSAAGSGAAARAVSLPVSTTTKPSSARRTSNPRARQLLLQQQRGGMPPHANASDGHGGGVHRRVSLGSGSLLPPIRRTPSAEKKRKNSASK